MKFIKFTAFLLLFSFTFFQLSYAKKDKKKKSEIVVTDKIDSVKSVVMKDTATKKEAKSLFKTIKEVTEKCKKTTGLFNTYQDTTSGKTYLEITDDKIGKEYIYFAYVLDGYLDAGYARGGYKDNSIFKVEKYFDRIDFVLQNTSYYFNPENDLSKAKDANINQSIFLSEKIVAATGKTYLIEADNLFLGENITQIKRSKMPTDKPDAFSLGNLNSKKSKYLAIKNFPKNTNVSVEYVYDNPSPINYGTDEITDARFVSVKLQHSLIEVPDNNFKPRADDARVGYFIEKVNDQTSTSATPWKDVIHKWNLQKKNPTDKTSEPVEPITWWIENTTPKEFRSTIKNAVLAWNEAFEAAGFKNAVVCKEQPDNADWDAEDIRYNVIRWTSSPRPPYGGYGPSFVNPRTGEILGADIMLEFIYLSNRLPFEKLYDVAALDNMQPVSTLCYDNCSFGEAIHNNVLYGTQLMNAYGFSDLEKDEFLKQALYDLVLHEVGHTFGLNHNFIASQLHSKEKIQDPVLGATIGLTASVMDYTIPNISPDKTKQGLFFDIKPGPYDKWAIQYGYLSEANEVDETTALNSLLSESTKKEYRFMNDADDMRSPGKGIDPRANLYDMSDDAIAYATDNIKMVNDAMPKLLEKYSTENQSYHELRNAFLVLTGHYARSLNVINRYIGGVYVNRNFVGQDKDTKPFTPVALADQKRAMQALSKYAFSRNAFKFPTEIYNYLQGQRRGFENRRDGEDPKISDRILNIQRGVLDQLLNAAVMQRLTDTKLYGNKYNLTAMMKDLTGAIFSEDLGASISSMRQNLQQEYVTRLLNIADAKSTYNFTSKSAAFGEIQHVLELLQTPNEADASSNAHTEYLKYLIHKTLDSDK